MSAEPTITAAITMGATNGNNANATLTTLLQRGSVLPAIGINVYGTASDGIGQLTVTGITFDNAITGVTAVGSSPPVFNGHSLPAIPATVYNVSVTSGSASSASGNINITYTVPNNYLGLATLRTGSPVTTTTITPTNPSTNTYVASIPLTITRVPSTIALAFQTSADISYQNTVGAVLQGTIDFPASAKTGNVVVSVSGVISVGGTGLTYNNSNIYAILVTLDNNPNQFNSTLQGQSFSGSGTIQNFNNNTVSPSTNYLTNLGVSGYGIRCYTYDAGSISILNQRSIIGKTVNFQGQLSNASSSSGSVLAIDPCAITSVN
jgi:hypothetical protein